MLRVFLVIDDYNELIYLQTLLKKLGFDVEGLQNQRKYADLSLGFNPQILITTARGGKIDGILLAQSIHKLRGLPKIIALKSSHQTFSPDEIEQAGIDLVLESPINPKKMILAISSVGGLDEVALFDKYTKMKGVTEAPEEESQQVLSFDENGQPIEEVHKIKSAIEVVTNSAKAAESPIFSLHPQNNEMSDGQRVVTDKRFELRTGKTDTVTSPENDSQRLKRFEKCIQEVGPLQPKKFDRDRIREFNKKIRTWPMPEDIEQIENERKEFVKALFKNKP